MKFNIYLRDVYQNKVFGPPMAKRTAPPDDTVEDSGTSDLLNLGPITKLYSVCDSNSVKTLFIFSSLGESSKRGSYLCLMSF